MKDFWDKYVIELLIAATIGAFIAARKFINYIITNKFVEPVEQLKKSLLALNESMKSFKDISDTFSDSLKEVKSFTSTFKKEMVENIDRIVTQVDSLSVQIEDVSNKLEEKINNVRTELKQELKDVKDKVSLHGEAISEIKATHNVIHSNKKILEK